VKSRPKIRTRTESPVSPERDTLAVEVERVARKRHLTMSILGLAQRGVKAEAAAHVSLSATYRRFMSEPNTERKDEAGKDLIHAVVFRTDAVSEDSIL
jgi:hypothetical protein